MMHLKTDWHVESCPVSKTPLKKRYSAFQYFTFELKVIMLDVQTQGVHIYADIYADFQTCIYSYAIEISESVCDLI